MVLLHILWMILRFLLIVAGVLLGIVLLLLLLALFCPVRYRAEAVKETESFKEVTANVSVSWLFRVVRLILSYKDGKMNPDIRLFGISLLRVKDFFSKRKEKPSGQAPPALEAKEAQIRDVQVKKQESTGPVAEDTPVKKPKEAKPASEQPNPDNVKAEQKDGNVVREPLWSRLAEKLFDGMEKLLNKLRGLVEKVRYRFRSLQKKKRKLEKQIRYWRTFLSHPRVKQAFALVWRKGKLLIRHVLPTRVSGDVSFGFEDPSVTGGVLAVMGMTIPLHKNAVQIHPDFEGKNHMEGSVMLK